MGRTQMQEPGEIASNPSHLEGQTGRSPVQGLLQLSKTMPQTQSEPGMLLSCRAPV